MNSERVTNINRSGILITIIVFVALVYTVRLFQLQIVEHTRFDKESTENSVKAIDLTPLRGVFYDRNRELLVENTPAYTIRITPAYYDTSNNKILEKIAGLDPGAIRTILKKNKDYSKFTPIKIKRGVTFTSVAWVEENSELLHGVDYIIELQRGYPAGVHGSHIFGYSKEVSKNQINADQYYTAGDLIGYNGIERKYESVIRGIKGKTFIIVDSKGREISKFKEGYQDIPSIKGIDLVLGIDAEIQRIAEENLKGKAGAVVAIEPKTGQILAMVSAPDYDLNEFSYVTSRDYLRQLATNPDKPQFNRATMSLHPPGSTFKVLCAAIALDMGVIDENTTLYCAGGFTFGRFFKCHGGVHGSINVTRAIEKSCNSFFYQLIFKIGLDNLHEYAKRFKVGVKTGIDIFEETGGLIPNTKYYEKTFGKNWPQGVLVSLGIGQGEISLTPLQLAFYTALIANDGKSFSPHIVKGYLDENKNFAPNVVNEVNTGLKKSAFEIVKKGMFLVVNGAGTATHVRIPGINVAGKTGTAQNPHGKDHAWFIGFAPFEDPQIAICVLVENSGFGGTHAAPIAKKMFESYLLRDKKEIKGQDAKSLLAKN